VTQEIDQPSMADQIRAFVFENYIARGRAAGSERAVVRTGDVHRDMGLQNRMPAVCSALNKKFEERYGVKLMDRCGPPQGANVLFSFLLNADTARGLASAVSSLRSIHDNVLEMTALPKAPPRPEATVFLVSCVGAKQTMAGPAKDLYISDWFRKARRYVERRNGVWFILSAKYGLISPEQVIEPYDCTLNDMPITERLRWSERVMRQMTESIPGARHIVFLAGTRYREFLTGHLSKRGITSECPMQGLRIGEQLSWLGHN
jgi:hypothetical protein